MAVSQARKCDKRTEMHTYCRKDGSIIHERIIIYTIHVWQSLTMLSTDLNTGNQEDLVYVKFMVSDEFENKEKRHKECDR